MHIRLTSTGTGTAPRFFKHKVGTVRYGMEAYLGTGGTTVRAADPLFIFLPDRNQVGLKNLRSYANTWQICLKM